jgi:Zn-dependent protease
VSLNPAVHVDLIGTIVFPLIALLTNVPVLGWAKPVPVDTRRLQHWRRDFAVIAAAGPISNLILALLASVALRVLPLDAAGVEPVVNALQIAVFLNVLLAVFNLLPVPPLDGGNVVGGLLRGSAADQYARIRPYGFIVLYGLMFTGILSALITPPARLLLAWLGAVSGT